MNYKELLPKGVLELGTIFEKAGYELSLVGGSVRDIYLNRPVSDWDLTTSALPDEIEKLLKPYADELWTVGKKFGTIGCKKYGDLIEITTYRSDIYNDKDRKPVVKFGDSLTEDLKRRDFTINAVALSISNFEIIDPFNGINDIDAKIIKTPTDPNISFSDDPLRIMRAFRFTSTLDNFTIEDKTLESAVALKDRLSKISKERIRDEFVKLVSGKNAVAALKLICDTNVSDEFIPELNALKIKPTEGFHHKDIFNHTLKVLQNVIDAETQQIYEKLIDNPDESPYYINIQSPDITLRLAAIFHDIGKPNTRKNEGKPFGGHPENKYASGKVSFTNHDIIGAKMTRKIFDGLRFDHTISKKVYKLVRLHLRAHGFENGDWTESAVRRYIHDGGELLTRLHILTLSDCTTNNPNRAAELRDSYARLLASIYELLQKEEFDKIRPDLNGEEIMQILNISPSRQVGEAYSYLLNYRIENGPTSKEKVELILKDWAKENLK
ncbi:MAG: CCA tRNA nucleotidyltransferase [Bifidobacteriaceae bacterium]|jgi:poly(A) polymerase|nr:CCA tRNA nucleotidyltransferase [Bifidobacteriaceae bacterium]